ncbi:MAG: hypothetical protein IPI93_12075 [Sphingobacteriaceae bacterium]|nr:hypothetical protein [Sphingobacteriaceae bacterium]
MTIKEHIIELLEECNELSVKEIVSKTNASKQMVHLALLKLIDEKTVRKLGRTPKTSYRLIEQQPEKPILTIPVLTEKQNQFLEGQCLIVTQTGKLLRGIEALTYFCIEKDLPFERTYVELNSNFYALEKYYDKKGKINATEKLLHNKAFDKVWPDNLFYFSFDSIQPLGRTPLATLLYYAKQGQSTFLMTILIEEVKERIYAFIKDQKADAVAFVPPTIGREMQFMKFLKNNLNLSLPHIEIKKINCLIPLPQYSILKTENKIRNADNTYVVSETRHFKHVIIIDDLVDTGATLNQIAGKIKLKGIAAEVTGLGLVGSFKGFEILNDE